MGLQVLLYLRLHSQNISLNRVITVGRSTIIQTYYEIYPARAYKWAQMITGPSLGPPNLTWPSPVCRALDSACHVLDFARTCTSLTGKMPLKHVRGCGEAPSSSSVGIRLRPLSKGEKWKVLHVRSEVPFA